MSLGSFTATHLQIKGTNCPLRLGKVIINLDGLTKVMDGGFLVATAHLNQPLLVKLIGRCRSRLRCTINISMTCRENADN